MHEPFRRASGVEIVFSKGFHDFLSLCFIVHKAVHLIVFCVYCQLHECKKGLMPESGRCWGQIGASH